jgi:hypothetical protein
MAKTPKTIRFVTPVGVAVYPKISEPDTKGKFADNKFKTDVDYGAHTEALIAKITEAAEAWGTPMNLPIVDETKKDENGKKVPTGKKLIRFKSKYRPAVFDAKKKPLPQDVVIGGGSEIRIDATLFPYTEGKGGVGLRLGPVQVANLVEGGEGAANFDEMEGFEYEADEAVGEKDGSEGFDQL